MLTDADVGLLVRIEFWDHCVHSDSVVPCTVVGWITRLTDRDVTLANWTTEDKPETAPDELTALIRSAITKVTRL